jgi:hypothetical protein
MSRIRTLLGTGALAVVAGCVSVPTASAANGPTFRDCSLAGGLDPDFVQLLGVTVGSHGNLSVPRGQTQVQLEASESSDPGDNLGHVTLMATVTTSHVPVQTVSGAETGKVIVALPLPKSQQQGRSYTISWAATFDNGNHLCPSSQTPENTEPHPFVVTVG